MLMGHRRHHMGGQPTRPLSFGRRSLEFSGRGLPKTAIYSMYVDRGGRQYVGTAEGLFS